MIIDIKQKFSLLGRNYRIATDGIPTHRARKVFFALFSTIKLYQNDELKITIIKELGIENYDVNLSNGTEIQFKNPSRRRSEYICKKYEKEYFIDADRGEWVQIFSEGNLVAGWQKDNSRFFNRSYQIPTVDDIDVDLIVAFCLICDDIQTIRKRNENSS